MKVRLRHLTGCGKRNIRYYLQSQGYYDADVDFRVQPVKNDLETIEYVISRGERQKLAHVAIVVGNKYFTADDIRDRMFTTGFLHYAAWPLQRSIPPKG